MISKRLGISLSAFLAVFLLSAVTVYAVGLSISAQAVRFDPGNTRTVASQWIRFLGEPDDTGDLNYALLLSKNTESGTFSSAVAVIKGVKNITLTQIGFDVRNGGHCGAGAPRFNVLTNDGVTHFLGCAHATDIAGAPAGWQRKTWSLADLQDGTKTFTPMLPGNTVKSMEIVFDDGVEVGPDFSGMVVLDNISVNDTMITKPGKTGSTDITVEVE